VTTPPPLPPDTTPPPPGPKPDLVITALDTRTVTVMNRGDAAAGAFNVTVTNWGVVRSGGLAAGASATLVFYAGTNCGGDYRAYADSQNEVVEQDELNNTRENLGVVC
jgi:subtilase family serine protease